MAKTFLLISYAPFSRLIIGIALSAPITESQIDVFHH
jgi:hypothetical protein